MQPQPKSGGDKTEGCFVEARSESCFLCAHAEKRKWETIFRMVSLLVWNMRGSSEARQ